MWGSVHSCADTREPSPQPKGEAVKSRCMDPSGQSPESSQHQDHRSLPEDRNVRDRFFFPSVLLRASSCPPGPAASAPQPTPGAPPIARAGEACLHRALSSAPLASASEAAACACLRPPIPEVQWNPAHMALRAPCTEVTVCARQVLCLRCSLLKKSSSFAGKRAHLLLKLPSLTC